MTNFLKYKPTQTQKEQLNLITAGMRAFGLNVLRL
jgi:hypothetical protein